MRYMSLAFLWMKMVKYFLVILVTLTKVVSANSCDATSAINIERFAELKNYANTKNIGKVQIFSRPYNSLAPIPMPSQSLENKWEIRISPRKELEYVNSILKEISNSEICTSQEQPDLYWGLVIHNREGLRIFSVYLERGYLSVSRVRGQIDGVTVEAPVTLLHWFESRFATTTPNIP